MNFKWNAKLICYAWWITIIFAEMKFLVNLIICWILGIKILVLFSRGTLLYFLSLCSLICWCCLMINQKRWCHVLTERELMNLFGYCCRIIPNVVFCWLIRKNTAASIAAFGNFLIVCKDKKFIWLVFCFGLVFLNLFPLVIFKQESIITLNIWWNQTDHCSVSAVQSALLLFKH